MSYETDIMQSLSHALRNTESLKRELKNFNDNIDILKKIVIALERQNELKEIELGLNHTYKKTR